MPLELSPQTRANVSDAVGRLVREVRTEMKVASLSQVELRVVIRPDESRTKCIAHSSVEVEFSSEPGKPKTKV